MNVAFQHDHYLMRQQVIALTRVFRLYTLDGQLVLFSKQKLINLKDELHVYSDDRMSQKLLCIQARQIGGFSAVFDVYEGDSGLRLGTLRRKGFRHPQRYAWVILDGIECPTGFMQEDKALQGLMRQLSMGCQLTQYFSLWANRQRVADFRLGFNPLRAELNLDFSMDHAQVLDRRLGIAAGLLLGTIEGKQKGKKEANYASPGSL